MSVCPTSYVTYPALFSHEPTRKQTEQVRTNVTDATTFHRRTKPMVMNHFFPAGWKADSVTRWVSDSGSLMNQEPSDGGDFVVIGCRLVAEIPGGGPPVPAGTAVAQGMPAVGNRHSTPGMPPFCISPCPNIKERETTCTFF